jgi:hypothetical protein
MDRDRTFLLDASKFNKNEEPNWAKPVTYRRQAPKPLSKRGRRVFDFAFLKMVAGNRLNKYERRALNRDLNRKML